VLTLRNVTTADDKLPDSRLLTIWIWEKLVYPIYFLIKATEKLLCSVMITF